MSHLLVTQPTRTHAWGIHIAGKSDKAALFLVVMDHEGVRYSRLGECWKMENVGVVAALLRTLASASLWALGCSPFIVYDGQLRPVAIDLGYLNPFQPTDFNYPPSSLLLLQPEPLSPYGGRSDVTPFSRGTVVFSATPAHAPIVENEATSRPSLNFVVKLSHVQDTRECGEAITLDLLRSANVPCVPTLDYAFSTCRLNSQISVPLPPDGSARIVPRHLTIVVTRFDGPTIRLIDAPLSFPQIAQALAGILRTLKASVKAGVIHRDISAGNLLLSFWKAFLNDWDCARIHKEDRIDITEGEGLNPGRTGTLDMAAIAVLESGGEPGFEHLANYDLESVVYFLWNFLSLRVPNLFPPGYEVLFGVRTTKDAILLSRQRLWNEEPLGPKQVAVVNLVKRGMLDVVEVVTQLADLKSEIVVGVKSSGLVWTCAGGLALCTTPIPNYDETVDKMIAIFDAASKRPEMKSSWDYQPFFVGV